MSRTIRSQTDYRLVPSLSTSPRRRAETSDEISLNSPPANENSNFEFRRLALALGFGPESVFLYADRTQLSPRTSIDRNGVLERFRALSISELDSSSIRRPVTVPLSTETAVLEESEHLNNNASSMNTTEANEEGEDSIYGVGVNIYNSNEGSPRPRRLNRTGRNIQRLRNESRELISQLSNENSRSLPDFRQAPGCPQSASTSTQPKQITNMVDLHYLQTKEYRNNFYYNLVSWSRTGKKLAVAANEYAYWWDGKQHVVPIELFGYPKPILVILCGPKDVVAIGLENDDHCSLCLQLGEGQWLWFPNSCSFQCIAWHPDKPILFTGDMLGRLFILEYDHFLIQVRANWRGFDQLVCGM